MPDVRRLRAWSALEQQLEAHLSQSACKLISFDVFDTLIKRRCHPELVVRGAAVALRDALEESLDLDAILEARHAAYADLAGQNARNGHDPETHLDELCAAWVERLLPDADAATRTRLAKLARNSEVQFERWACLPNPTLLQMCARLSDEGYRLIYVSDMYLGDDVVAELLERCGFGEFFSAGYVSGDHGALKRTGRLFQQVAGSEGLPPDAILHIGDDMLADGEMAEASGVSSIVVRDRVDLRQRRRAQFDLHRLRNDREWAGVVAADYVASHDGHSYDMPYLMGRNLLGAQLASMLQYLIVYCLRHDIKRVYFLSREGLVLRAMYDSMVTDLDAALPRGDYLCVSRIASSYGAMGEHYGLREIIAASSANAHKSARRILAPLGFGDDELTLLANECGLHDLDAPARTDESPAFARLVGHPRVSEKTREVAQRGRAALRDYLRRHGFYDAKRVALVDVGWGAQIQENLVLAVSDEDDAPEVHGMYLGANRLAAERRGAGLRIDSSLADETRYEWSAGGAFDFVQMYEISSRAPHGTVLGYREGEPELAQPGTPQRDREDSEDAIIARMQRGMIDAAVQHARCVRMLGASPGDTHRYVANLACRANRFPRRREARFFLGFQNVSNYGAAESIALGEHIPWWRPVKMARAVNRAMWSEGVASLSLGPIGTVTLAILKAARVCRLLPAQNAGKAVDLGSAAERRESPHEPFVHAFEPAMLRHWEELMREPAGAHMDARIATSPAITVGDVLLMWSAHRASRLYLKARGLEPLPARLLSPRVWLQRSVFTSFGHRVLFVRRQWRRLLGK